MKRNALSLWRDDWASPILDLQREVDRLFGDYTRSSSAGGRAGGQDLFQPPCDVEETDSHYLLSFDLPGVNKDDIQIELKDHQLVVSGSRKSESRQEGKSMRVVERSFGSFQRVFSLPSTVDEDKVEATYEDGVLTLALPKAEAAKPKQIRIGEGKGGSPSKLVSQQKSA